MLRLCTSGFKRNIFRFNNSQKNEVKGIKKQFRLKQYEQKVKILPDNQNKQFQNYRLDHILINQIPPYVFLIIPVIYYYEQAHSILFLQACNTIQYYTSGLIFYNALCNSTQKKLLFPIISIVAVSNCLTGYYGIIAPLLMGIVNLYLPFIDQQKYKFQTEQSELKAKIYFGIQGLIFFMLITLFALKLHHNLEKGNIEKLINNYSLQNFQYYKQKSKIEVV